MFPPRTAELMREFTLAGLAAFLAVGIEEAHHAKREALERGAEIIETEAKRVIGTYDYDWPPLKEATQREREREGFAPNRPLLRTGDLKGSIKHQVYKGHEADRQHEQA
jgi:hypothetical protein